MKGEMGFNGEKKTFKAALNRAGAVGRYKRHRDGCPGFKLESEDGGVLNWYASTGTITLQGNEDQNLRRACNEALASLEDDRLRRYGLYRD